MAAIAWWGIPIGATLISVLWASRVSRPRRPGSVHDTVESYQRFRAALEQGAPVRGRVARPARSTIGSAISAAITRTRSIDLDARTRRVP